MAEPPLEEKVAFFQRLDAIRSQDDSDDEIDAVEKAHRERCSQFHSKDPSALNKTGPKPKPKSRSTSAERTAPRSSSARDSGGSDIEIVKVTPRTTNTTRGRPAKAAKTPGTGIDDSVIPDTVRPSEKSAPLLHPLLRGRIAGQPSSALNTSPSTSMAKRKKTAPLKLAPENQQMFRGLSFYYIPNDDADGVRKAQIRKARERGASWVRKLEEATHVIVNERLGYKDIQAYLGSNDQGPTKIVVNTQYPIDCVAHRTLLNPEQGKYVKNLRPAVQPPVPQSSSAPPLRESQREPSSSRPDDESVASETTAPNVSADDELTQMINVMQNDPVQTKLLLEEEDEEADQDRGLSDPVIESESEASSNERAKKKRRTSKRLRQSRQEGTIEQNKFACMNGGTLAGKASNPNARTIELLQALADNYDGRDQFRCLSYRKAIAVLSRQNKKIMTAKEAAKFPGIGESIANKIEEIVTEDRLRKLEYAEQQPEDKIMRLFLNIYGVGINQANTWVSQGYRSLDDLKEKAKLSPSQRIGIDHFDDLNEKIPRWEVEALAGVVKEAATGIDPAVEIIIGGSYRRGSASSGDIDLIITKKKTETTEDLLPFLRRLVEGLTNQGFLTAALASFSGKAGKGHGSKWHGCCVLPETASPPDKGPYRAIWRRIDLLLVPESEFGAALIYFTGNDVFNRSIRLLASKKGMRLNQRGLYKDVLRGPGRVKCNEGDLVEGRDEKRIFELLGVKWREPHERCC